MKEHCYEMCVVFSPSIEDKRHQTYEMLRKMIKDHGGDILGEDDWGMKTFAYPMKKFGHGFYSFFYFQSPSSAPAAIANLLKMEEDVLRHMFIKRTIGKDIDLSRFNRKEDTLDIPTPVTPEPAPVMQTEEPAPVVQEMAEPESDEPETQAPVEAVEETAEAVETVEATVEVETETAEAEVIIEGDIDQEPEPEKEGE